MVTVKFMFGRALIFLVVFLALLALASLYEWLTNVGYEF
jgi:hypothetical protein